MKKKTLTQRVEDLEYIVYRKWIEDCPRCGAHAMNELQKGVCKMCAFSKDDLV